GVVAVAHPGATARPAVLARFTRQRGTTATEVAGRTGHHARQRALVTPQDTRSALGLALRTRCPAHFATATTDIRRRFAARHLVVVTDPRATRAAGRAGPFVATLCRRVVAPVRRPIGVHIGAAVSPRSVRI